MKIAFISASPGGVGDGIGDYTERLCNFCLKHGHDARKLPFYGKNFTNDRGTFSRKCKEISKELNAFKPDVLSWQYDGNIFSSRRIFPASMVPDFSESARLVHIMVHETWEGYGVPQFKKKIKGYLQRRAFRSAINVIDPDMIHVSIDLYKQQIAELRHSAEILPMFATIPYIESTKAISVDESLSDPDSLKFVFFGGLHCPWAHGTLMEKLRNSGKICSFHHVGRLSDEGSWRSFTETYSQEGSFHIHGQLAPEKVSAVLSKCDFAISTYPSFLLGKSTVNCAYVEHGLPIIHCRPLPDRKDFQDGYLSKEAGLIGLEELPAILNSRLIRSTVDTLEITGNAFLKAVECKHTSLLLR